MSFKDRLTAAARSGYQKVAVPVNAKYQSHKAEQEEYRQISQDEKERAQY